MTNKKLFEQAIADAKSIRESALANAKAALEESITPKLQRLLAKKLQESEEKELDEHDGYSKDVKVKKAVDENLDEELDLDEMLAELELEEGGDDPLNENQESDDDEDEPAHEPTSEPSSDETSAPKPETENPEMGGENGEEMVSDEDSVKDLSVGDLKDILRDLIAQEMSGSGEGEAGLDDLGGEEHHDDLGTDDMGALPPTDDMHHPHHGTEDEDEFNLDELLQELEGLEEKKIKGNEKELAEKKIKGNSKELAETKAELNEAIRTVKKLRSELNEVNLLNAKLLYVNRIFKAKNLTESQKVKIITTFDKVSTVKDAKLVYEALETSLKSIATSTPKKPITESKRGFASKPAGFAPKSSNQPIVDETMAKWQFLAGIKKNRY